MTEEFGQYSDRTYKMLKGLRKSGKDGFQEPSCMEVPEKRNRALLPKYGQAIRAHCPQKGEILTKKVTDHEIIWLEYEEENPDCFESDVSPVTQSVETNRLRYSEMCDEYINYFKMLSSYSYESSLCEYHIEMIFDEQKLRELESDRFNILRMLLKSPNTRKDGSSTRADKYDENIHVVNTDLCMGQLNINETNVANVKEQMRKCLRHTENNTDENITTAATSGTTGEHTNKSKSDGPVIQVKEQDITGECHVLVAAGANEGTPYVKDAANLREQNQSTVTVAIDIGTLSCNICTDAKELNSSAATSDISGSKTERKPVEVIEDVTVPIVVKENISVSLTVHTDLHETERKPADACDGNFPEPSDAETVTSDDSETDATVAEIKDDILSINDTIDGKRNATECDIESLSDLSSERDDYGDNEIDNHADVINPLAPTKEPEDTEDDDSGLMCGILWVYASGQ